MRLSASAIRFGGRVRQSSRSLRATLQHFPLKLLCPATADILARQVDDGIHARKFLRIERLARIPLHFVLARRSPNQGNRFVTNRNQSGDQRPSYQTRSAADQYSHVPLLQASFAVSCNTLRAKSKTRATSGLLRRSRIIGHGDFAPAHRDQCFDGYTFSRSPAQGPLLPA